MQHSCLKISSWWSPGGQFVENGYLSLRFPNMVKVNIHEHWTRVTRFNPWWVSGSAREKIKVWTAPKRSVFRNWVASKNKSTGVLKARNENIVLYTPFVSRWLTGRSREVILAAVGTRLVAVAFVRDTQRGYNSKPLNIALLNVF